MGKIYEQLIDRFDGGMTADLRSTDERKSGMIKHLDNKTISHRLLPRPKSVALTGEDKTIHIVKMIYAPYTTLSNLQLWGFGADPVTEKSIIYRYDNTADSWNLYGSTGSVVRSQKVFFHYKWFLFWFTTSHLSNLDISGVSANHTYKPITYTNLAEPVHHPADDVAYFFYDNIVASQNGAPAGTWTAAALTLPSNIKITCACAYGDYLAIGTVTLGGVDERSTVYVWDRDSSLSTVSAKIDFGYGAIKHLATLDGKLIGIVDAGIGSSTSPVEGKVYVKQAAGNSAVVLNYVTSDQSTSAQLSDTRVVAENKLSFPMRATLYGDDRFGIWSVDSQGGLSIDFVEEEATSYEHIYRNGDTWLICHSGDYSTNHSASTYYAGISGGTFSTTLSSVYETLKLGGKDRSRSKKLVGVTVMTEPLPAAGQIVLKYRKDEEESWTTIFTESTDDSMAHDAINIESSGAQFPQFKEIQFQVNSTGGAVITGIKCKYEEVENAPY